MNCFMLYMMYYIHDILISYVIRCIIVSGFAASLVVARPLNICGHGVKQ